MRLKITLFGLTLSSSWGNGHATPYRALIRALHARGHHLVFYEKDVEYYARRRDFNACDYCDLVLYRDWQQVRARALASAAESDVTMVASYCPGGAQIAEELLALHGPLHVYYDMDTPVTLQKLSAGDLDYLRAGQIPCFDLYLSFTGGRILQELGTKWGARCARPLYGCVDPDIHRRVAPRDEYRCLLSYMGTYAADRQGSLDQLFLEPSRRMPHAEFVLAGSLYPHNWRWPENVRRFEHVAPADHPTFYSSSRATLNLTRSQMAGWGYCPSGRFFEAAACGTAILSDSWEGLATFFRDREEIFLVDGADDVARILPLPDQELARVAARARERTLQEHSGQRRAQELLLWIEQASARPPAPAASEQREEVVS